MLTIQNQTRASKIFKCTIFVGYGGVIFFLLESHLCTTLALYRHGSEPIQFFSIGHGKVIYFEENSRHMVQ